jgi:hypothetical protein
MKNIVISVIWVLAISAVGQGFVMGKILAFLTN